MLFLNSYLPLENVTYGIDLAVVYMVPNQLVNDSIDEFRLDVEHMVMFCQIIFMSIF